MTWGSWSARRIAPNTASERGGAERDRPGVALHPLEGRGEATEGEPDDEERRAEAERVGGEQQRGTSEVLALGGEVEHGAEHRADAGRPAEPERGAGDGGGEPAEPLEVGVEPELLVEARGGEELGAGEVRGHEQDEAAGDAGEGVLVLEEGLADAGRDEPEEDEHDREPGDEEQRVDRDAAQRPGGGLARAPRS